MTCDPFKVLTDNQALKHFKTAQKLSSRQCCYLNLISDFNFHIKYHSERANVRTDALIRMSDCISDNEDERIQGCYQVLLPPEQFQITALEKGESTQWSTSSKHNFYKQVKKANQVNRKLK